MMEIELYREEYREDIIELVLSIENGENRLGFTLEEQPDLQDPGQFEAHGGRFWMALEDGRLIGTLGLMKKTDTVAVLKKFFVRREYRGTETAKELYRVLLDFARENGIRQIILDTPSVAKRAHRFYEREGFRQITGEELPVPYEFPDRNCRLYLLNLS